MDELKYLIRRDKHDQHLLETEEYRQLFYDGDLSRLVAASGFQVKTK